MKTPVFFQSVFFTLETISAIVFDLRFIRQSLQNRRLRDLRHVIRRLYFVKKFNNFSLDRRRQTG